LISERLPLAMIAHGRIHAALTKLLGETGTNAPWSAGDGVAGRSTQQRRALFSSTHLGWMRPSSSAHTEPITSSIHSNLLIVASSSSNPAPAFRFAGRDAATRPARVDAKAVLQVARLQILSQIKHLGREQAPSARRACGDHIRSNATAQSSTAPIKRRGRPPKTGGPDRSNG
jgi:hypothetical protein